MWSIIVSIVPIILGITGLVHGYFYKDVFILIIGSVLIGIGLLMILTLIIIKSIINADNRNIMALNEIINGLSD